MGAKENETGSVWEIFGFAAEFVQMGSAASEKWSQQFRTHDGEKTAKMQPFNKGKCGAPPNQRNEEQALEPYRVCIPKSAFQLAAGKILGSTGHQPSFKAAA